LKKTFTINEVYRIAGEAKLVFYTEGEIVKDSYFITTAPVRGFEKLIIGKNPLFAIEAVMRICGICHTSHGIAGSEAIENALGIMPPKNGLLLREALGLINRIQSHILQFVMISGDFLIKEKHEEILFKLMSLHAKVSDYLLKLGGAATHPPNITIGGTLKPPKESIINNLKTQLPNIMLQWKEIAEILLDENIQTDIVTELKDKKIENNYIASHLFYGDRFNILIEDIKTMPYYEYRSDYSESNRSTTLVAFYEGKKVEAGPRSRLKIYHSFKNKSLYGIHIARVEDVTLAFHRLEEILDEINLNEPFRTKNIVFSPGKGVGVYEAPRGTLIHYIELGEEGRVLSSKIVVPTMFNIPVMEDMARELSIKTAEAVIRLYDPCIPCTTHIVRLR